MSVSRRRRRARRRRQLENGPDTASGGRRSAPEGWNRKIAHLPASVRWPTRFPCRLKTPGYWSVVGGLLCPDEPAYVVRFNFDTQQKGIGVDTVLIEGAEQH